MSHVRIRRDAFAIHDRVRAHFRALETVPAESGFIGKG
jgi:hypothetical protein